MRGKSGWLALGAAAAFVVAVVASEPPPDSYVKNMKETAAASKSLKENVEGKNWNGAAKDAATLKELFQNTQDFWSKRNAEDAITQAKKGEAAAGDVEKAAMAKNEQGVLDAQKSLNMTCKTCHDAHRERMPDGTSQIK
ncbi:MAG: hypothetical protein ACM3SQ_01085 [Betaproteobacteria bacterium]